jgi:hypothetical protein
MELALDPDPDPTMFLWLQDLSIAQPSPIRTQHDETPLYSAYTARLFTFCFDNNISRPRPEEVFFSMPFAIWLQPDTNLKPEIKPLAPVCHPFSYPKFYDFSVS